jgi:hypothetical protein
MNKLFTIFLISGAIVVTQTFHACCCCRRSKRATAPESRIPRVDPAIPFVETTVIPSLRKLSRERLGTELAGEHTVEWLMIFATQNNSSKVIEAIIKYIRIHPEIYISFRLKWDLMNAISHNIPDRPEQVRRLLAQGADPNGFRFFERLVALTSEQDIGEYLSDHEKFQNLKDILQQLGCLAAEVDNALSHKGEFFTTAVGWTLAQLPFDVPLNREENPVILQVLPIIQALLDKGADPDACFNHGLVPLSRAADLGAYSTIKALLAHNANANAEDFMHWTPIIHAARYGCPRIVQLLLDNGANPYKTVFFPSVMGNEISAQQVATHRKHAAVVETLEHFMQAHPISAQQVAGAAHPTGGEAAAPGAHS